jgi:RHS repeat-associated protein
VETIENAKLEKTVFKFNTLGQLEKITAPDSLTETTYTYDSRGRVWTITQSDGFKTVHTYDNLDRPRRITYLDTTYKEFWYDRLGLSMYRDRQGRITKRSYNKLGQLTDMTDAKNQKTSFNWCDCGVLDTIIDPLGHQTTFHRDIQGRLIKKQYDDGKVFSFTYENARSLLKTITDAKGQVRNYEYEKDDNLRRIYYTNALVPTPEVTFSYDPYFDRLAAVTDGTGTTRFSYYEFDGGTLGAGQVKDIDGPLAGDTITYSYDELGRVVFRNLNFANVGFSYDNVGRLASQTNNSLGNFTYTYVAKTARLKSVFSTATGLTATYDYFPLPADPRLKTITNTRSTTTLSRFDYTYYPQGAVESFGGSYSVSGRLGGFEFLYDQSDQLSSATVNDATVTLRTFGYSYDAAGNRKTEDINNATRTESTPNNVNQILVERDLTLPALTQTAQRSLVYDDNGNLQSIKPSSGAGSTFTFDAADRLVSIKKGTLGAEFSYDGFNRWTKIVEKNGSTVTNIKQFVWCGLTLCEERTVAGARRYFPEGYVESNGAKYYFTKDHLGSVRELVTSSGSLGARYQYDPYGKQTRINGAISSPLGYTGHYFHSPTGLYLATFRVYDPVRGRWINRDPIGEAGGINLYGYVYNTPTNLRDGLGLDAGVLSGLDGVETKQGASCDVALWCGTIDRSGIDVGTHCGVVVGEVEHGIGGDTGGLCGGPSLVFSGGIPPRYTRPVPAFPPANVTSYPVACGASCDEVRRRITDYMDTQSPPPYAALGPNSNTFAHQLLNAANCQVKPIPLNPVVVGPVVVGGFSFPQIYRPPPTLIPPGAVGWNY